jgi:ArsR family transcriptional regulator
MTSEGVDPDRLAAVHEKDPALWIGTLDMIMRDARAEPSHKESLKRLQAAADETRFLILRLLEQAEDVSGERLTAADLQYALGVSHSTISHHMTILQDAGLVRITKKGRWIQYQLDPSAVPYLSLPTP